MIKRITAVGASVFLSLTILGQQPSGMFDHLKWRMIGPYRGGRTVGAVGIQQQPNVFYIGVNNGGVWKTTDYGRTWFPIFDDQPTGSIGDVKLSPSNPDIIYVASGEGIQRPDLSVGNGMYKSIDAGKTWEHLGLDSAQQLGGISVDPQNPDRLFVAALGHPYGPNNQRGVFRSMDGGASWQKVLYKDENTGAVQVTIDPVNPQVVYAYMWAARQGPWENGQWNGSESGLYKSVDGGDTWHNLTKGLPGIEQGLTRIGFGIAPTDPKRLYATVDCVDSGGIYRSDDAGESWRLMTPDERYWGRGEDFAEITVDPKNADIVYTADVVTWKSIDGAKTWSAFRGAPGGDDYHRIWINPLQPQIMLIASDQGAIVTVNGGETFSSWYNQPTAQMYHVSTDNDFPYNVYSGQQESGSACVPSRSYDGQITFHDWHPIGAQEYGYVVADPLNSNIVYGGKLSKYNKITQQAKEIAPEPVGSGKYRFIRTAPLVFSEADPATLYYAGNVLFKTKDGGDNWQVISPDLSRETWDVPASVGVYTTPGLKTMPRRGVIYTIAPSPLDTNIIWCGTDDGLIHITNDGGKNWQNVTPPQITSWSKISIMDAGHFDKNTAYAAVNCIRLDDMRAHIYKTTDAGKTWTEIVNGITPAPINVVREDPQQKGVLYAGSETEVFVSLDEGAHWQSLRQNMPATSIRDLVIKDDDLVVGTHGRGFWIMDNVTSMRQLAMQATTASRLYKPALTYRVRWNTWTDTPLPQEEPAGENPPDGALIDIFLDHDYKNVSLEIFDSANNLVRRFSNQDTLYTIPPNNVPRYWIAQQNILPGVKGSHRFVWDLHYQPLNIPPQFPISAVYKKTNPQPTSPWVMPGRYLIRVTTDGTAQEQAMIVKMDPRVKTSQAELQNQLNLSMICYLNLQELMGIRSALMLRRDQMKNKISTTKKPVAKGGNYMAEIDTLLEPKDKSAFGVNRLYSSFLYLMDVLQQSDMPPTSQAGDAVKLLVDRQRQLRAQWKKYKL